MSALTATHRSRRTAAPDRVGVGTVAILDRLRRAYREIPALSLTVPQACLLWGVDPETCQQAFDRLVAERFLVVTPRGTYVRLPAEV